jgi:hypothetical protein
MSNIAAISFICHIFLANKCGPMIKPGRLRYGKRFTKLLTTIVIGQTFEERRGNESEYV